MHTLFPATDRLEESKAGGYIYGCILKVNRFATRPTAE